MFRLPGLLALSAASLFCADLDRDGIDDAVEQKLLQQFLPSFVLSGGECDVAPAEFAQGLAEPRVVARNGTIYGQVLRAGRERVEIHYYHLWGRDCGPSSHALDAEHVSALVRLQGDEARAEYWYAAAHEDTLCDAGSAAKASALRAEDRGPRVWISRGKHGSFLSEASCRRGCGGDRCEDAQDLVVAAVINVGEPGAPMAGATWIGSSRWPLRAKMGLDFDAPLIARVEAVDGMVDLRGVLLPAQAAIAGGGRAVVEVDGAKKRTENALADAQVRTETAVGKALSGSTKSVKSWMRRRLTYAVAPSRN